MNLNINSVYKKSAPFKDVVDIEFQAPSKNNSVAGPDIASSGVPSLFNPYAIVVFPILGYAKAGDPNSSYNDLMDGGSDSPDSVEGNRFSPIFEKSAPSIANLVEDSELSRKTPYHYADFLYCKYVGKIPNNQLITLRRYPAPTFDNLGIPGYSEKSMTNSTEAFDNIKAPNSEVTHFFPIAQAVTWFGEETGNKLSDLLSFSVNMNWKLVESEVNVVAGNEQGSEDSPAPGLARILGILTGQVNTPHETANSQYDPYNGGPYSHRVYGPVNTIAKTYKRDRGLDFKQSLAINFEYSLKSIGSINPKAAMLDLMSNLLALTYNNAAFWGGANRYFPQKPTYPFLGGKDGMNAWYRGQPVTFAKAVGKQWHSASSTVGAFLSKFVDDPIKALKELAVSGARIGMIEMGKGRAPAIVAMKALLTGEPIGEWHMVIGNPYKPIAKIGNLICTEAKFQFNDIIGADNFPTELKVTINIEHGRPRDAGDIQSMFNDGHGRIYYPAKNMRDILNKSSSTRNSTNDTSWGGGGNFGGQLGGGSSKSGNKKTSPYHRSTRSIGLFGGSNSEFNSIKNEVKRAGADLSSNAQQAWDLADKMFMRTAGSIKK